MAEDKHTGRIKLFQNITDFVFIVPDDGGPDVFLHITTCKACGFEPKGGVRVQYDWAERRGRGHRATWVMEMEQ